MSEQSKKGWKGNLLWLVLSLLVSAVGATLAIMLVVPRLMRGPALPKPSAAQIAAAPKPGAKPAVAPPRVGMVK